jgi:hypothetical protein
MAPVFLPIAVAFGYLFRGYDEGRMPRPATGGGRFLREFPVILQSLLLIAILVLPPFLKDMKLGGDLVIMHSEKWWWLVAIPILTQAALPFLPNLVRRRWKAGWFVTVYALSVLFLISLVFPASDFLAPYKSAYPLSQAIQRLVPEGREVYQYKISLYGIDFYDHMRAPVVEDFGELGFGINLLPPEERARYFLSAEAFYGICKEKGDIYIITQYKERLNNLQQQVPGIEVLWSNGAYYLVHVRR